MGGFLPFQQGVVLARFVDRIRREVSFDRPTLFISHLTAAHWPYYTADIPFGVPFSTPARSQISCVPTA